MSDLASDSRILRSTIAGRAIPVCATCDVHGSLVFDCAAFGEDGCVFDLSAVAPDGGFLLAHERDIGGGRG